MKRFHLPSRRYLRFILAAVSLLAVLLGVFAAPVTVASTSPFADEVLRLVNAERAKAGLPAFAVNETLNEAARRRAQEESTRPHLEHKRPDGRPWYTILDEDYDITCKPRSENLAFGQRTPGEVVRAWMNSSGHRNNILGNFTQSGVGIYLKGSTIYWAQLFINHDGSELAVGEFALGDSAGSGAGLLVRVWEDLASLLAGIFALK